MKNYMDESFVVVNDTIILYNGKQQILKVPSRFADIEVSKIGKGAFIDSSTLQCISLPPKIEKIRDEAFWYCHKLTSVFVPGGISEVAENAFDFCDKLCDITIYGLELTISEYHTLKNMGIKNIEDIYILREIPNNQVVQKIIAAIPNANPACEIPDGISSLFHVVEFDEEKGKFSLEKNIPIVGLSIPSVPNSENNAFSEYIKNCQSSVYDSRSEEKNDWYVRVGKISEKEKTIIFTFDDSKTREEKDKVFINATLKIGYFFWQSAEPVIYEDKKYYIYRRYYLNSDPNFKYVRRDIAVYTDDGLVKDRKEAQNVYAKYKLLSIL